MKKIITAILILCSLKGFTQISYTPMTAAGYQYKYLKVDSGLLLPYRNLSLGRGISRQGALVVNTVDGLPYYYDVPSLGWIPFGSGGTTIKYVDSITINGNNLFYWKYGLGYGIQLNKVDSIKAISGNVYYYIGGTSHLAYATSAAGTVTSIATGYGLTGGTITTTGTLLADTTVLASKAYANTHYAPYSHVHNAADITSGTLPIARGGTGLSGIGSVGQLLRVASSGTDLEYFTPDYINQSTLDDTSIAIRNDMAGIFTSQDLQAVTNNGYITTNPIISSNLVQATLASDAGVSSQLITNLDGSSQLTLNNNYGGVGVLSNLNLVGNATSYLPRSDLKTLVTSVDGNFADLDGNVISGGGGGSAAWGSITGTLSSQTDLQTALNAKQNLLSGTGYVWTSGGTPGYVTVIPTADGGTNLTSYTTGDILYASATNVLSKLPAGTNGDVLKLAGGVPSWAASSSGTVTSVTGTSPISVATGTTTPVVSIANAAADGSTKGAASFTANDFDASSGNISLDYTNGQAASGSTKGFLTSADWATFNGKQAALSGTGYAKFSGSTPSYVAAIPIADGGTNITTYTTGDLLYASASNTLSKLPIGTSGQALRIVGGVPVWRDTVVNNSIAETTFTGDTYTFTTSAPTGSANKTYQWTQVGNMVILRINIVYATGGVGVTSATFPLPAGCPTPHQVAGLTASNAYSYQATISVGTSSASRPGVPITGGLRYTGSAWEVSSAGSATAAVYWVTVQYWTN